MASGAIAYGGYKLYDSYQQSQLTDDPYGGYYSQVSKTETKEEKRNTNPFDGPVDGDVFVGDISGNVIPVPEDHQLEGTNDGKWIQVKDKDRAPTGTRKDGGGHPREKDVRGREPHGHVPGVTNSDGTPWLPIY